MKQRTYHQTITLDGFESLVVEYYIEQGDEDVGAKDTPIIVGVDEAEFYDQEGEYLIKTSDDKECEENYSFETLGKGNLWDDAAEKLKI